MQVLTAPRNVIPFRSASLNQLLGGDNQTSPQDQLNQAIEQAQDTVGQALSPVFIAKKGLNFTQTENLPVGEKLLGYSQDVQVEAAKLHPLGSYENMLVSHLNATGVDQTKQSRLIAPMLPGLQFKATNEVIAKHYKVKNVAATEGYYNTIVAPKTTRIQTDYDKFESVTSEAVWMLEDEHGNNLIAELKRESPWDPITLNVFAHKDQKELVDKFYGQVDDWCKENNYYKNKVLEYVQTMDGEYLTFKEGLKHKAVTWDDISIPTRHKESLQNNTVNFFDNLDIYKKNGKYANRNILLPGPPGTGKSMVNDILFTELKGEVTFIHVTSKSLQNPEAVAGIFDAARMLQPCGVIFEDLDLVGSTERNNNGTRKDVLNEMLNQMSGVYDNTGLVVLGSTNRADAFDAAMLRPLRFSTIIPMELPDKELREKILRNITKSINLAQDVNLASLAERTPEFSGAGLTELKEMAVQHAIETGSVDANRKVLLRAQDFDKGLEIIALKKEYLEKMKEEQGGVAPAPKAADEFIIRL